MPLERADAVAVRLLDLGYFRIGSDIYADTNGSFGLTTLEKRHVRRKGTTMVFHFVGKSGIEHSVEIDDPEVIPALDSLRRRRGGTERLLAYLKERRWSDLDSSAVNLYLSSMFDDLTAKDFRTWHATVLAAAALAASDEPGDTKRSRQRAIKAAVSEVAEYLGNTPTIARNSYIDPRVIDLYEAGTTIDPAAGQQEVPLPRRQAAHARGGGARAAGVASRLRPMSRVAPTSHHGERSSPEGLPDRGANHAEDHPEPVDQRRQDRGGGGLLLLPVRGQPRHRLQRLRTGGR